MRRIDWSVSSCWDTETCEAYHYRYERGRPTACAHVLDGIERVYIASARGPGGWQRIA